MIIARDREYAFESGALESTQQDPIFAEHVAESETMRCRNTTTNDLGYVTGRANHFSSSRNFYDDGTHHKEAHMMKNP
jgi:hypothetical protein